MCGIAGILAAPTPQRLQLLQRMADAIAHRGPDHQGAWDDGKEVMLAHRRLAVLDLSPAGQQPMHSSCGRYHLVFNGEIYNYRSMKAELSASGMAFRGNSDTEVLLGALTCWGIDAVRRCNGMFAIAIWDSQERVLHLVRDRMGEKPLYYATIGGAFLFGSELRALREAPGWSNAVDRASLSYYLAFGYVPEPRSIMEQVRKVPAAGMVSIRPEDLAGGPAVTSFWSLTEVARTGSATRILDEHEALEAVEAELTSAVQRQMVSDVPLGAFLSGGIDSSLVVALMQRQSQRRIRTFTIGFEESGFDERQHAGAVARHLGTEHTEFPVTAAMALEALPRIVEICDEPLNDSSQIPTFLVCSLARSQVTVALSGDGADELFAGYHRHVGGIGLASRIRSVPGVLRRALHAGSLPLDWMARRLPGPGDAGARLSKVRRLMVAGSDEQRYQALAAFAPGGHQHLLLHDAGGGGAEHDALGDDAESLLLLDQLRYLPGDILVKIDRAAMAVGLETRAPFLDHGVVELSWRVPMAMKIRNGQGKWLLRQLLARHLPLALARRPKQGFSIPLSQWLNGALRPWAEALLDEGRLRREGFFHPQAVRRLWQEHCAGRTRNRYTLWGILMFQSWLDRHLRHG